MNDQTDACNEPEGSVRFLDTARDDLIALRIIDKIAETDAATVFSGLDAVYRRLDRVDLMVIIEEFEGFDPGVLFSTETWRVKWQSMTHVRRYALVGGPIYMRSTIAFFGALLPMELRCFALAEEAEAWRWLQGSAPARDAPPG